VDLTEKIQQLTEKYKKDVRFVSVYIREAHAKDGWELPYNSVCYLQPKALEQRAKIARDFLTKNTPQNNFYELWLDGMDNQAALQFKADPERLYIIRGKKIAMVGGPGPFEYCPFAVEKWLVKELGY